MVLLYDANQQGPRMVSFTQSLKSCNIDVHPFLSARHIESICHEVGHQWRDGKLPPGTTVHCMMEQMAHGNISCSQVRQMHGGDFSAEAYAQARGRLPLKVLEKLNRQICARVMQTARLGGDPRWKGHRVFINDGSGFSMPDTPELLEHFGIHSNQKTGCGFPICHLLLQTGPGGAVCDVVCSPCRTRDMTCVNQIQQTLRAGDIVLGDRLFSNWGHLSLLRQRKAHGLFQMHHSRKAVFGKHQDFGPTRRLVRKLGHKDQITQYAKPAHRPKWMSVEEFENATRCILVRELQLQVKISGHRKTITLVTTLLDEKKYPPADLSELLGQRWNIEICLRHLKTTMGLEQVRCKTVEGVKKELMGYLLVYNIVRLVMLKAATRQKMTVNRIRFADALAWLKYHPASNRLCKLLINPQRSRQPQPRVIKLRKKPFAYMTHPRKKLRQALMHKRTAA